MIAYLLLANSIMLILVAAVLNASDFWVKVLFKAFPIGLSIVNLIIFLKFINLI